MIILYIALIFFIALVMLGGWFAEQLSKAGEDQLPALMFMSVSGSLVLLLIFVLFA